jgi:glycolate oxidase iron-sulfur subunit
MEAVRADLASTLKRPLKERAARAVGYRGLLADPGRLRMAGRALKVYQRTPLRVIARGTGVLKILPGGLDYLDKTMPRLSDRFFVADGRVVPAIGPKRARVAMLAGCVMTLMHAPALEAATRVLARNGVEVVLAADQGCCGALNTHAGEREPAREMARRNVDSFLAASPDAIVVASAGCGSTMKEYGELLRSDPEYAVKAERVGALTRDIHEFLVSLPLIPPGAGLAPRAGRSGEPPEPATGHPGLVEGRPPPLRVTYQDACHLINAQRIAEAPRQLLRAIPGVELVEMPEAAICCGSAGTYSVTQKEMSQRLGRRKARNVMSVQPDVVATGNPGCALQLENYLRDVTGKDRAARPPRVRYVVELLDEAYAVES